MLRGAKLQRVANMVDTGGDYGVNLPHQMKAVHELFGLLCGDGVYAGCSSLVHLRELVALLLRAPGEHVVELLQHLSIGLLLEARGQLAETGPVDHVGAVAIVLFAAYAKDAH